MANEIANWFRKPFMRETNVRFSLTDFSPHLTTQLLILQPTPFCNLDCDYCYLPDRDSNARMTLTTVRQIAEQLSNDQLMGNTLTVIWHAGEPLVMPRKFYADAFKIFTEVLGSNCQISHSIQTNATLIDDAWCALFKQFHVRIGVSIDGPQDIHDRHRKTRMGKGSFDQVIKGMETLRVNEIPYHVISVITVDSLSYADELHEFFIAQGIRDIGFNFDEAEGPNTVSSLANQEEAHFRFYHQMLNHMIVAGGQYQIRELANATRLISSGLPKYSWQGQQWPLNAQTLPFAIITVAWNGDFSTFSPELLGQASAEFNNFVLGNVAQSGFLNATNEPLFFELWQQIREGTCACRNSCAYFNYCGGGAPANKLYENSSLTSAETLYCRSMLIRPFEVVLQKLEQEATQQNEVIR